MAKKKQKETEPDIVTLDGKEYDRNKFTDEQNAILNHVNDMQMKLNTNAFMREQLIIGQEAFVNKLRDSLNSEDKPKETNNETIQSTKDREEMVSSEAESS